MTNFHKTTTNYSGRTADMLLLQFVPSPVADAKVVPDVSKSPRIVSGIEKLVQRFALLFLTGAGTVRGSSEGTNFMPILTSGRIYDLVTLRAAAATANKDVASQIRAEDDRLGTPDDEALETSEVLELSLDRSTATVSVKVKITTVSGDSYVYVTPLATGV